MIYNSLCILCFFIIVRVNVFGFGVILVKISHCPRNRCQSWNIRIRPGRWSISAASSPAARATSAKHRMQHEYTVHRGFHNAYVHNIRGRAVIIPSRLSYKFLLKNEHIYSKLCRNAKCCQISGLLIRTIHIMDINLI